MSKRLTEAEIQDMVENPMCCFCGVRVPRKRALELAVWLCDEEHEGVQGLWCHYPCLEARVHPSVSLLPDRDDPS